MKLRFFRCDVCSKTVFVLTDTGIPTFCCGQPMRELYPNKTDGAQEKHVPVWSVSGSSVSVRVGSEPHPMTDAHRIVWIGLRTEEGYQWKELSPEGLPEAHFFLAPGDAPKEIFAYCNLHGLWSAEI